MPKEESLELDDEERARVDAADRWGTSIGAALMRFVAPIYERGPRHPTLIGSGLLLGVEGEAVLVTAAHVMDDIRQRPLEFGAGGTIRPITGKRSSTLPASNKNRDDDPFDLGFVRLGSAAIDGLTPSDLLDVGEMDAARDTSERHAGQFFVLGYPASRQPRRMENNDYEAKPFAFVTEELDDREYEASGTNRHRTLLTDFNKAEIYRSGKPVEGPNLDGVSGGVVWRLPSQKDQRPSVAAIVVAWRKAEPLAIVATRSKVLWHFLASRFPNLRKP